MTSEKLAKRILVISLGFATLIVFSSFFKANGNDMQAVTFVLLTLWLIPFSYLLKLKKKINQKSLIIKKEEK